MRAQFFEHHTTFFRASSRPRSGGLHNIQPRPYERFSEMSSAIFSIEEGDIFAVALSFLSR